MATKRKIEALGEVCETVRDALEAIIDAVAEYVEAEDKEAREDAAANVDYAVSEAVGEVSELAKRLEGWE